MWPFTSFEHRENKRLAEELREEHERMFRRNAADAVTMEQAQKLHNALNSGLSNSAAMGHALGYGSAFVGAAPAPKLATDLPLTRVADLAGYLGRVNEQLAFAALVIAAPIDPGPAVDAIATRFRDAAEKAGQVQLDLLKIIQQEREDEADRVARENATATRDDFERMMADAMQNRPQWAPEDLERYRNAATATEPLEPNRIRPVAAEEPDDDRDPART